MRAVTGDSIVVRVETIIVTAETVTAVIVAIARHVAVRRESNCEVTQNPIARLPYIC